MDVNEFLKFVRDRQLINNSFSEQELHHIFNKVQDEEGAFYAAVGNLGLDDTGMERGKEKFKMSMKSSKLSSELDYSEFLAAHMNIVIAQLFLLFVISMLYQRCSYSHLTLAMHSICAFTGLCCNILSLDF